MQLNIKNGEAYRMAKRLSETTGESLTDAVTNALRERLERIETSNLQAAGTKAEKLRRLMEIAKRFDELPVLDDRSADEITAIATR